MDPSDNTGNFKKSTKLLDPSVLTDKKDPDFEL